MFGRLAPLALRPAGRVSTQRLCNGATAATSLATSGSRQQRAYASDGKNTGETGFGSETKVAGNNKAPKESIALDELINSLKAKEGVTQPIIPLPAKYSDLLRGTSPLKGDNAGFMGTGRFGGTADRGLVDEDLSDPMSKLVLHVHASSNNTILSLTDASGKVLINASGGTVGFRKAQRAGFEAAYQATASIASKVKERGIPVRKVEIRLKGFGAGREAAFKAVHSVTNWVVCRVIDTTPIPFNGCRPKKARRL
ncbi:hypothetical protein H4R99_004816 [Coemansia sp. RSA 1722]|nr:hypothetical protein LPJ57_009078 [Coemansia sp. RSA 486]KAJ2596708.1 hypothetical protein H4R99_004816 [Coemansia sp. RSA 1722]